MATRRKRDLRRFIQVSVDLLDNPKVEVFDQRDKHTIVAVAVAGWTVSSEGGTDGEIMPRTALRKADAVGLTVELDGEELSVTDAMVKVGLWHKPGHTCARCPQPRAGRVQCHDIDLHQQLKADREDLIEKRRRAGRESAKKRWGTGSVQGELPLGDAAGQDRAVTRATTPAAAPDIANAMTRAAQQLDQEPEVPPRRPRAVGPRKSKMRADYTISEENRVWAKAEASLLDIDREHERFVTYWLGRGTPMEDWDQSWRSWMQGEQDKARARRAGRGSRGAYRNPDGGAQALKEDWADTA